MNNRLLTLTVLFVSILLVSATIDLDNLFNYENQTVPNYITKDNTGANVITDEAATLGRVLFYDKKLSANNTIACGSCHQQQFAFSDTALQSVGLSGGVTGRHSMRLVNTRFADEVQFFWDERANSLEDQSTQPIQDHVEMGFSGTNGDPNMNDLIAKMDTISYYKTLFNFAFGDSTITEARMQFALAQFIRSIQSFDSKFDDGLAQVNNINQAFPNFTAQENQGKQLFIQPPNAGGAGCQGCHRGPEFDIDPNSLNNGVVGIAGQQGGGIDITNTRSPSLRDLVNPSGDLNGPLMHNGRFTTLLQVINHYDSIVIETGNTNIDPRLGDDNGPAPGGNPQNLNLTNAQKQALVAFLLTLTGSDMYTNEKWSDPFDANGELDFEGNLTSVTVLNKQNVSVYPSVTNSYITIQLAEAGDYDVRLTTVLGASLAHYEIKNDQNLQVDLRHLSAGLYRVVVTQVGSNAIVAKPIIKY